jgi:hypothetical protein
VATFLKCARRELEHKVLPGEGPLCNGARRKIMRPLLLEREKVKQRDSAER